jgi:DNA-binding protein YbaB
MLDQVKKVMEMRKQAEKLKKEMEATLIEVQETRGIKVVVNGAMLFQSIEIEESLLNAGNKNRIQMDLLKNLNTAVKRSQQAMHTKMKNMPGLNLPGMM